MKSNEITNLLWTGGRDSTFRLLFLLLVKHRHVQLYYIIDPERKSTLFESRAMQEIRQHIFAGYPDIKDLLRSTRYVERFGIQPNKGITQSYQRISGTHYERLGTQYDWIARFAHESGTDDLELSVHYRGGKAYNVLEAFVVKLDEEGDSFFKIDPKYNGSDEHTLFRYFRFPILTLTMNDMEKISRNEGFDEFMGLTWFCHTPRANGAPCGVCNPCIFKIEGGFGRSIPFSSRIRYHLRYLRLGRMGPALVKYPRLYGFLKSVRHKIHSN